MESDILGGYALPNCPFDSSSIVFSGANTTNSTTSETLVIYNPTVSLSHFLYALISFCISLRIFACFNSAKIFNRLIEDVTVKNLSAAVYFLFLSAAYMVDSTRYTLNLPKLPETQVQDTWLLLLSTLFKSISTLWLSLWLNEQRKYRSSESAQSKFQSLDVPSSTSSPPSTTRSLLPITKASPFSEHSFTANNDHTPLLEEEVWTDAEDEFIIDDQETRGSSVNEFFGKYGTWENTLITLFLLRILMVFLITSQCFQTTSIFPITLSTLTSVFQNLPILILSLSILRNSTITTLSPKRSFGVPVTTKCILLLACGLHLINWIDISVITRLKGDGDMCIVPPYWNLKTIHGISNPRSLHSILNSINSTIPHQTYSFSPTDTVKHGWASVVDVYVFMGFLGSICWFWVLKREFKRCKDEWVRMVVREIQDRFDFRRC